MNPLFYEVRIVMDKELPLVTRVMTSEKKLVCVIWTHPFNFYRIAY